jgi:hypothetical protein
MVSLAETLRIERGEVPETINNQKAAATIADQPTSLSFINANQRARKCRVCPLSMKEQPVRCDDCPGPARAAKRANVVAGAHAASPQRTEKPIVDGQPITSAADFINNINRRSNELAVSAQPARAIRFTQSRIALHAAKNSMQDAQLAQASAETDEMRKAARAVLATAEAEFNEAVTEYLAAEKALRTES